MSEFTEENSPRYQMQEHEGEAKLLSTPLRRHLDDLLNTAGWTYEDLSPQQIRTLVSLLSDRQHLLSRQYFMQFYHLNMLTILTLMQ